MNVNLEIPKEREALFLRYAKEQNKSINEVLNERIMEFLEELEDLEDALKARKERANGDSGRAWQEIRAELRL